jgi:hypothetical protein
MYKASAPSGEISVHNVAMLTHSELFDPGYFANCYTPNYHRASYRQLCGTNLTLQDLTGEKEPSGITGWHPTQHDLREHLAPDLVGKLASLYPRAFAEIGWSARAKDIRNMAMEVSLPKKLVAIHLRSGDMVFGECRKWGLWSNKVINISIGKALVERFRNEGYAVLVATQDSAVSKLLTSTYGAVSIDDVNAEASLSTAERALHDMMLMSRADIIVGGRSGFSRFPALIKGRQVTEVFSIFPRLKYSSLTESDLLAHPSLYHPLHEAYAWWQAYCFNPNGRSAQHTRRLLDRAASLDPGNLLYPLTMIYVALSNSDYRTAEEELSELLSRFYMPPDIEHPVIQSLLHKYPTLDYSRRKHFVAYERAATETSNVYSRMIYTILAAHTGSRSHL